MAAELAERPFVYAPDPELGFGPFVPGESAVYPTFDITDRVAVGAAVGLLRRERANGAASVHDLSLPGKHVMAQFEHFTTTTPRHPGKKFGPAHERMRTKRELGALGANYAAALTKAPEYRDDKGLLPRKELLILLEVGFSGVTGIEPRDIYAAETPAGDRVTMPRTVMTMASNIQAQLLYAGFDSWLHTLPLDTQHAVRVSYESPDGKPPTVTLDGVTEYNARVIESAYAQLIAEEDAVTTKTILPSDKLPLSEWEKTETLHPDVRRRLLAIAAAYTALKAMLVATYDDRYPNARPWFDPSPLGSTPAAAFELWRKAINGLSWEFRGPHAQHHEQDPVHADRLLIETGIDIRRDRVSPEQAKRGPAAAHRSTQTELHTDRVRAKLTEVRGSPKEAAIKVALETAPLAVAKFLGGLLGLAQDGILAAIKHSRTAWNAGKWRHHDRLEWRAQKQTAATAGNDIDRVIAQLSKHLAQLSTH